MGQVGFEVLATRELNWPPERLKRDDEFLRRLFIVPPALELLSVEEEVRHVEVILHELAEDEKQLCLFGRNLVPLFSEGSLSLLRLFNLLLEGFLALCISKPVFTTVLVATIILCCLLKFLCVFFFAVGVLSEVVDTDLHALQLLDDPICFGHTIQEVLHFDEGDLLLIFLSSSWVHLCFHLLHLLLEEFLSQLDGVRSEMHLAAIEHFHEFRSIFVHASAEVQELLEFLSLLSLVFFDGLMD